MHIRFAHLCDYALIANDQKLSVLGIFSVFRVADLPATLPRASLAFEIELNHAETNQPIAFRIDLVDADGHKLLTADGEIVVEGPPKIGKRPRFAQIMNFNNLRFERAGAHEFNFWLGGSLKHQLPFQVHVLAQKPPPIAGKEPPPLPG